MPVIAAIIAAALAPLPSPPCDLTGSVLLRQSELPRAALAALPFRMADRGEPFEISGRMGPGLDVPRERMICAKRIGFDYLIRFEEGWFRYSVETIFLRRMPGGYFRQ
jgi:hypothetical protein